jgi:hypothetical protein
MSWLSQTVRRNKGVIRKLGKGIDFAADFVPIPIVRDGLNVGSKLMQNKNLRDSLLETGLEYAGGKIMGKIGRKTPLKLPAGAAPAGVTPSATVATGGKIGGSGIFSDLPGVGAINIPKVPSAGGGRSIADSVKRGVKGLTAGDVIKGATAGYDVYNKEKDRAYDRKRTERGDQLYEADRLRRIAREDELMGRERQDRQADTDWFNSLAPMRERAQQMLLNPAKIDYSDIFNQPRPVIAPITTPEHSRRRPLNR